MNINKIKYWEGIYYFYSNGILVDKLDIREYILANGTIPAFANKIYKIRLRTLIKI